MSRVLIVTTTVAALTLAILSGNIASARQRPTFRSTADTVPLFVTVADATGRRVADLTPDDFLIFDNGAPQPVTLFDASPQPIRLITLIDMSSSMAGNVPLLMRASAELVAHLKPGDLVRAGTFGQEIVIGPAFTREANELTALLSAPIAPNATTPLWRAVDRALAAFGPAPEGRPVVLILSDGRDSGPQFGESFVSVGQVRDRAQHENVMIYGVGLRSSPGPVFTNGVRSLADVLRPPLPDPGLSALALDTGGGYFELTAKDDLAATFARVIDELHRQYLVGFAAPTRDGAVHTIEVRAKRTGLTLRARKTYTAPK